MLFTHVTARLVPPFGEDVKVATLLDYNGFDPFAIKLEFSAKNGPVEWRISRDLLLAGMTSEERFVGEGDVKVQRVRTEDRDELAMLLSSPSGEAFLLFDLVDISRFVGKTLVEMPLGDELLVESEYSLAGLDRS